MTDIHQNLHDVEIQEEVQKERVNPTQPDQQDFEEINIKNPRSSVEEVHTPSRQLKTHESEEQARSHTSVDQIKNLTQTVNEQLNKSSQHIASTPQRAAAVETTQTTQVTSTKASYLSTDQLRSLTHTVDEQLAKSAQLRGGSARFSSSYTVQNGALRSSVAQVAQVSQVAHSATSQAHYKSVSEVSQGLSTLHSQVDKIIGRSPVVPNVTSRSLYASTYIPHQTHYVHEIHSIPTYYSREASPSRTVQATYYVPTYTANSYASTVKPAYDVQKLDSLVSNILGHRTSAHHTVSHYASPVKHAEQHYQVVSHSAAREVQASTKQVREVVTHASYKEHTTIEKYACGEAQNDVDSMVLDRLEGENQDRKEHEEEYKHYFTSKVEDDQEEEPKPVRVSKRREILNNRRNNKGSQQFESHQFAEEQAAASPQREQQVKAAPQKNELERKGPYDQRNKQTISPEKAQKYFNEDEKNLGEFKF